MVYNITISNDWSKMMEKYLVGGAVRDKLLGKSCNDKDFVIVGATVEEMITNGYKQVGNSFPVFLDENGDENALARIEKKCGNGHTSFEVSFEPSVTLEEDLYRRDLTINAIAEDKDGNIIDPYNGREDLKKGLLKHVSMHFMEDPLRVLRVARFSAQLGFEVSPDTKALCKRMINHLLLSYLSAERVWKELEKALSKGYASHKFFETLNEINGLNDWFKDLEKLTETPEKLCFHPSGNSFAHTMIALKRVQDDEPIVKFMVLCHDLGKGETPEEVLPAHIGHEIRGLEVIDRFCDTIGAPNDYRKMAKLFCKTHMKFYRFLDMRFSKQFNLVREVSANFRDESLLEKILKGFDADFRGEDKKITPEDKLKFNQIIARIWEIYFTMENKGLEDLDEKARQRLEKLKGEKFGEAYNQALISYCEQRLKRKNP